MLGLQKKVPDFILPSSSGKDFRLSDKKGKVIVLYFYPKDKTPGCTLESGEFNDLLPKFKKLNAEIYGISRDNLKSHAKFIEEEGYKFELLSDVDEKVCKIFDVIKEKSLYGKKFMGIERSTFVIDADGKLAAEFRKVKPADHAAEILGAVKELAKES